jgi:magnesium chelatase subunit I
MRNRTGQAVARVADVYAGLPAITGKIELEYEGELQGGDAVAREIIRSAAAYVFGDRAPTADVEEVVTWFEQGGALKIGIDDRSETSWRAFGVIPGLLPLVYDADLATAGDHDLTVAACELVLEALAGEQRISRTDDNGWQRARRTRPDN